MKDYPEKIKTIYMLGIGGIGMSALARYFNALGMKVSGYDRTSTPLTDQLISEGIAVHFSDDPDQIPGNLDLCIYTPAIPKTLREFIHISTSAVPLKKRAAILGEITRHSTTIAVSGTHGKTTVSTMIAHILHHSGKGCSAFLGGISKNYNSNFLHSDASNLVVVEADEFDKSFLELEPNYAVVTSMDADHLDIYSSHDHLKETFRAFVARTRSGGHILMKHGLNMNFKPAGTQMHSYALEGQDGFHAENIRIVDGRYAFSLVTPTCTIEGLTLQMPGLINVENAVAAAAIAWLCGVDEEGIRAALAVFQGIKRRFDVQVSTGGLVYIDDYAHHPEEIRGLITSVKKLYPGRRVLGIFQPHLFTRTRDFAQDFAKSLDLLDEVILLPIYPAREEPIAGVDSMMLLDMISITDKSIVQKSELVSRVAGLKADVILTIGAGDIDQLVEPLKKALTKPTNA